MIFFSVGKLKKSQHCTLYLFEMFANFSKGLNFYLNKLNIYVLIFMVWLFYSRVETRWNMWTVDVGVFSLHLLVAVLKLWLRPSIQINLLYNLYSIRSMITTNLCYKFKCSGYLSCEPVLFPWLVWEQKMLWIRYKMETSNDTFTIWYLY